ncbi:NADH-quinone oxidoreductase subunit C [Patulibacter sp. SYSU D01012]|uniref:NADH-quinone oxidoreductase subunit C n=1 Tax=Patulibacter sp. SYSU D01012 TaxID=2817381 RepID=UPI001B30069F
MPDTDGLQRLAGVVGGDEVVLGTVVRARRAELHVRPETVVDVLERLRAEGYTMLMSLHGVDYFPQEPRFGVAYELLSMQEQDRVTVKVRVPLDDPHVPSVTDRWPTASFQEREVYDMFGVIFDGHPDLRRILLPEDYIGHPQRRDFPIGGEPVLFTGNEGDNPGWWK